MLYAYKYFNSQTGKYENNKIIKINNGIISEIVGANQNGPKYHIFPGFSDMHVHITYTFDNTFPDRFSPKYSEPLVPPKEAVMLKVITYRGKEPVGRMIYMPIDELQKRANKKAP